MLSGILFLLARGNIQNLASFRFTPGDLWVLGAAVFFAFYNILVRKKPASVSAAVFLFTTFSIGTIFLVPFSAWEMQHSPGIEWNTELVMVVLYLGLGTSVVAFLLWNFSIARLGAARTALFGNLIPLFSSVEAVLLLDEQITVVHIASAVLIIAGLLIANSRKQKRIPVYSADN